MVRSIKGIRCDLELSQEDMAKKLNVPVATYQRYENLKSRLPSDVLVKIADEAGILDVREIKFK